MRKRKKKKNRRTYKFQLREHPKNVRLGNMLDDLADVHNHFLALEKRYYRRYGKYAGRFRLQPHLTKLLERTKQHWAWIPRDTLDAVIIRIHVTYERFFDGLGGLPKFKRKDRYRSAKFPSAYLLEEGRVRLSFKAWDDRQHRLKFNKRWFSFHQHRDYEGKVCYIQILRDRVGTYWLYVITDASTTEPCSATGESVGIDFGMETYLTFSTGEKKHSPQFFKHALKELRTLNKSISRKVKGSHNWWRCVRELARLYRHITNQRKDWHYKVATDLCKRFDTIVTETLNLSGMKRLWGRKVSDLAFGQFVEILKYKCQKHGRHLLQVGQWTPSTKPCSDCGHTNENLSLSDRQWTCPECGSHHDRDINAAINILRETALGPSVEQT
ncbi:IS200/IS605 family element transposase accessory protein TnpB [Candidatus Poribacteria bacterium]|nr:IS200/IS605 family element transposase accessory protein TnpB [Candidatus Poribacteria bacterium]